MQRERRSLLLLFPLKWLWQRPHGLHCITMLHLHSIIGPAALTSVAVVRKVACHVAPWDTHLSSLQA